jgi:hypothetical protein
MGLKENTDEKSNKKIQMDKGKDVEKEHDPTYKKMKDHFDKTGQFPDKETMFKWIAEDHLDEFNKYYIPYLEDMEKKAKADKKKDIKEGIFDKVWINRLQSIIKIYESFKNTRQYKTEDGVITDLRDLIQFMIKKFNISIIVIERFLSDYLTPKDRKIFATL